MSVSSQRGKVFEQEVAAIIRKKLGARVARDRRSGAGVNKSDLSDYYQELPFSIECKDQETIKVKEWMRQAIDAASFTQIPTLVFRADEEILATVRFEDLVNLAVEIADLRAEINDLRAPAVYTIKPQPPVINIITEEVEVDEKGEPIPKSANIRPDIKLDKEGHITDQFGYCNQKGCKYSRGYKPPKGKK